MNPRIAKDIRAVLPSFGLTLIAALVPGFLWRDDPGPVQAAFGFASVLMAAMILGHDVRQGTLALLLAQPLPRGRLWREKMQVLGAALAVGLGVLFLGALLVRPSELSRREFWLVAGLITLTAFCTTPYWTLLYRNTLLAVLLTAAVPALLLGCNAFVCEKWVERPGAAEDSAVVLLLVYCAALGWLGWRRFRNLQLVDGPLLHMQRELSLPPVLEGLLRRPFGQLAARWRGPLAALFKKELRLQLISFVAAGFFCLIAAAGVALEPLQRDRPVNWGGVLLMLSFGFYVPVLPLLAGTIGVAEEKGWGVADWQFALPVSLRCQWWIKVGTALLTSLALGFFLPQACYLVGVELFENRSSDESVPSLLELLNLGLIQILMTSLAILAGTIATNTSRALVLAMGLVFGAAFLFYGVVSLVSFASDHLTEFADTLQVARMVIREDMLSLITAEFLLLLAAIHGLAYRCYGARGLAPELFTFRTLAFPVTAALLALLVLVFIAAGM